MGTDHRMGTMRTLKAAMLVAVGVTMAAPLASHAQSLSPYGIWGDRSNVARPSPQYAPQDGPYGDNAVVRPRAQPKAIWSPASPDQPMVADGGARPEIQPVAPQRVSFQSNYEAGVIIVDTGDRKLFRVNGDGDVLGRIAMRVFLSPFSRANPDP